MLKEKLISIISEFSDFNQKILELILSIDFVEIDMERTLFKVHDDKIELNIVRLGDESIPFNITLWKKDSASQNGLSMFFFDPRSSKQIEIEYFEDVENEDQEGFLGFISSILKSSVTLTHFLLEDDIYRVEIRCSELNKNNNDDDYFLSFDKLFILPWKRKNIITKETHFLPWT